MACFEPGTIIELDARDVVTLPDVRKATLRVMRGTLWITQEGDPQDLVLRAGDNWVVERNGLTVVEAQNDASFCVIGRRREGVLGEGGRTGRRASPWAVMRHAFAEFLASPTRSPVPYF
jgi:hypothetical protein